MIVTGAQIKAARALLNWTQQDLANAAGIHKNAVAYWEARALIPSGYFGEPHGCRLMRKAIEAAGVKVFDGPSAGVRYAPRKSPTRQRSAAHNVNTTTDLALVS